MKDLKAVIFDLDGVLVDTSDYHFRAWKRMCDELGMPFTEDYHEQLKGVTRDKSLDILLKLTNTEMDLVTKYYWLKTKNDYYLEHINKLTPANLSGGVLDLLIDLRDRHIRIGLGSASKNARTILKKMDIEKYFNIIVDGNEFLKAKPNPEIFLLGVEALDVEPENTVIFEDSVVGVQAALNGDFYVVGVGDENILKHAQMVIPDFQEFKLESLPFKLPEIMSEKKLQG